MRQRTRVPPFGRGVSCVSTSAHMNGPLSYLRSDPQRRPSTHSNGSSFHTSVVPPAFVTAFVCTSSRAGLSPRDSYFGAATPTARFKRSELHTYGQRSS